MTNRTCTVVVGPWDEVFENRHKVREAYGCGSIMHAVNEPVAELDLGPGMLVISENPALLVSGAFEGLRFDFPVRVVTYKVAIEMVKIDEEGFTTKVFMKD